MKTERVLRVSVFLYFEYTGWELCLLIASVADLTQSSKPTPIATVEKYSLNISAIRSWSFMISLFSERVMWFPFLNFLSEKNGETVFQKFLSCFEHLSSKYLRIEYFRILTTKFLRRMFSSQQDFPYFVEQNSYTALIVMRQFCS